MSSREGYQRSGENVKFGENGEFDDISLKAKIREHELKRRSQLYSNVNSINQVERMTITCLPMFGYLLDTIILVSTN